MSILINAHSCFILTGFPILTDIGFISDSRVTTQTQKSRDSGLGIGVTELFLAVGQCAQGKCQSRREMKPKDRRKKRKKDSSLARPVSVDPANPSGGSLLSEGNATKLPKIHTSKVHTMTIGVISGLISQKRSEEDRPSCSTR